MSQIAARIRITQRPHGVAPEWVRDAWIGCEFPCLPECGHIARYAWDVGSKDTSILSVSEFLQGGLPKTVVGFSVSQDIALAVLAEKDPAAARWFMGFGYPKEGLAFRFKTEEVEVIAYISNDDPRRFICEGIG